MSDDPLREMARGWCDDEGCLEGWRVDSLTALLHRAVESECFEGGYREARRRNYIEQLEADKETLEDQIDYHEYVVRCLKPVLDGIKGRLDHHTRLGKEE